MTCDLLHAGRQLVLIPGERRMHLGEVMAARNAARPRPSWLAMFTKAFAAVAARHPELRRVFVARPWHRLYEYDHNIISIIVERDCGGEPGLFLARLQSPAQMPLTEIDARLRRFKDEPIETISHFRNALRLARWPLFLRRPFWSLVMNWMPCLRARLLGTMGISITAGLGGVALSLITPWTTTFFYDMFDEGGSLTMRVMFDHRVFDGKLIARAMKEIDRELCGPIRAELLGLNAAAA